MLRTKITITAIVGIVLLLAVGCKKQERKGPTELRIATQPAPLFSPIFVAKQLHWLEDELKADAATVKWSSFIAGPPENESFLAGQQDLGVLGDTPAIIARSAGLKSRIIGTSATGPKALALIARKDSTIGSPADLRGHKVAGPTHTTCST
jgi:sulfonate transport system substrate-binding protein